MALAHSSSARIQNLLVRTATLEDVFIAATGKRLRD
jgi:hypothetical protein